MILVLEEQLVIAQFSDIHCGDARFDTGLMESLVTEIEYLEPDLIVIPGDLTADGFVEQFQAAHDWISKLSCPNKIVVPGNHDARNVGLVHFGSLFPPVGGSATLPLRGTGGSALLVAADTSKPDLNQGEFGRGRLNRLTQEMLPSTADVKILIIHHHLVSVPGTGRERNILWDAGDLLEVLSECRADLVLCGHRHVPFVWQVNGIVVAMSGTACTRRTRGRTPPSFNIIRVTPERIEVTMRNTGEPTQRVVTMPRRPQVRIAPVQGRRGGSGTPAAVGV